MFSEICLREVTANRRHNLLLSLGLCVLPCLLPRETVSLNISVTA